MAEFAYNNGYQACIGMAPFETLYGRKCRSPIHWSDVGECAGFGPRCLARGGRETSPRSPEIAHSQSRQMSYAKKRRRLGVRGGRPRPLEGVAHKGREAIRSAGEAKSPVHWAVRGVGADWHSSLSARVAVEAMDVHNVFHVSNLRTYIHDPEHALLYEPPELQEDMSYEEFLVMIIAREVRKLWNREIPYVKIRWSNHDDLEATWELENLMKKHYPHLFEELVRYGLSLV
uniref:Chromo domain-containing protein n=1 Tax=Ananas comosus var. bracteatus TaxID=296719 RepID=A0A6V7PVX1_ANACO|nr:unnamed protein product [Ananas comosus var. bracteatus]